MQDSETKLETEKDYTIVRTIIAALVQEEERAGGLDALKRLYDKAKQSPKPV